jgi:hypothetical protein
MSLRTVVCVAPASISSATAACLPVRERAPPASNIGIRFHTGACGGRSPRSRAAREQLDHLEFGRDDVAREALPLDLIARRRDRPSRSEIAGVTWAPPAPDRLRDAPSPAREQRELFEAPAAPEASAKVRLDRIRVERGRSFGDVWLGWTLWQALRLDTVCEELLPRGREEVPWAQMAAVLVLARLCEPPCELHIAEDWYRRTALEDLLGLCADRVNEARLYRALDQLLPHKTAIEQHLVKRLGELFDLSYDLLLYDVTSTYFEGQAARNPLAQRGHSRDHRPDCKQVCIALVVTREGMPLGYEVFAGNRVDVTTVEEIVETMEARYGITERVWVMDRGMTSAENVDRRQSVAIS